MRKTMLAAALLTLVGAAAGAEPAPTEKAVASAREAFRRAADAAETAYRETAIGSLRVFTSRLADAERARVRAGRIDEANAVRAVSDRFGALADELGERFYLRGVLPRLEAPREPFGIGDAVEDCRTELAAAAKAYREALEAAAAAAEESMAPALALAIRCADLDAANAIEAVEDEMAAEIRVRTRPLEWRVYRFRSMEPVKRDFTVEEPSCWRTVDGELVGSASKAARLLAAEGYRSLSSVAIRGRILPPPATNFRLGIGPLSAIFNWELAPQSHFRWYAHRTISSFRLTPGKEQEITIRQLTRASVELGVDGKRVYLTHGDLAGTVCLFPSCESTIGVREIRILGVPDGKGRRTEPSHRLW